MNNDNELDQTNESVSGNNSGSLENEDSENNETTESVVYIENSIDYSNYFENLQTIGIFICGLLVAYGIAFAFFKGFKR